MSEFEPPTPPPAISSGPRPSARKIILGVAGALTFLGALAGFLAPQFKQKLFTGITRIQFISPRVVDAGPLLAARSEPLNIENEMQILTSRENLIRVVNSQNLVRAWGSSDPNTAATKLQGMVIAQRDGASDLVTIKVLSPDMNEAASLANAVGLAYEERERTMISELSSLQINALENELEQLEKRAEDRRSKLQALLKQAGPTLPEPDASQSAAAMDLDLAKKDYEATQTLNARLRETIDLKKIAYILPTCFIRRHAEAYPDPTIIKPDIAGSTLTGAGRGLALGLVLGILGAWVSRPRV
jgi:uncharacterized protein involved in exopolysaccharide biosynthesis